MSQQPQTAQDVKAIVAEREIRFIRFWFTDILGQLKSFSINAAELDDAFEAGMGFDGSSITGFNAIEESDMIAMPDPSTFAVLPWRPEEQGVGRMFCDVLTPERTSYEGDPRHILRRALQRSGSMGFDVFNVGPELVYFLFRDSKTTEPLDHQIAMLWAWLAVAGLGGLLAGAAASVALARWVSRPLGALEAAARELGSGVLGTRSEPADGPGEVRSLAPGQAVFASLQTEKDRLDAVVVQSAGHFGSHRQIVIRIFFRFYGAAFKKCDGFVQHSGIAGGGNVAANGQRQPKIVVGTVRANSTA